MQRPVEELSRRERGEGLALYDLHADAGETKDLAKSDPQVLQQLERDYDAWWKGTVPLLENEHGLQNGAESEPVQGTVLETIRGPRSE